MDPDHHSFSLRAHWRSIDVEVETILLSVAVAHAGWTEIRSVEGRRREGVRLRRGEPQRTNRSLCERYAVKASGSVSVVAECTSHHCTSRKRNFRSCH